VVQEEVAEGGAAAADARLHGTQGDARGLRYLLVGEALDIAEDDDEALVGRDGRQAILEVASQLQSLRPVLERLVWRAKFGGGTLIAVVALERYLGTRAAAAQLIVASVGGDPQEPRPEAAAPEAGNGTEGRDERLLGSVLGGLLRAEHTEAEVVDLSLVGEDEGVEGVQVAALASFYEYGFVCLHAGEPRLF
jgi:hypothetical protein